MDPSVAKEIGSHGGKSIENTIDIEDLKKSHLPIQAEKKAENPMRTYQELQ